MNIFSELFKNESAFDSLSASFNETGDIGCAYGICKDAYSLFANSICDGARKRAVFVTAYENEARALFERFDANGKKACFFPARDLELIRADAVSRDFSESRIRALKSIVKGEVDVIFTSIDALLQNILPKEELTGASFTLSVGESISREELITLLDGASYKRFDEVEGEGQYSVRGGIVDVFPSGEKDPYRLEFFGDEIDSISSFDVISQRRSEKREKSIDVFPAKEAFFPKKSLERIKALLLKAENKENEAYFSALSELEDGGSPAWDVFYHAAFKESCLLDYIPDFKPVFFSQSELKSRLEKIQRMSAEAFTSLIENGKAFSFFKEKGFYHGFDELSRFAKSGGALLVESFFEASPSIRPEREYTFSVFEETFAFSSMEPLNERIKAAREKGYKIIFLLESSSAASSLYEALTESKLPASLLLKERITASALKDGGIYVFTRELYPNEFGISLDFKAQKTLLFSPRSKRIRREIRTGLKDDKTRQRIVSYAELKEGDLVVHAHHGIGVYRGIEQIGKNGFKSDYIKIQFAGSDVLFVPCNNLDNVSKYIGADSGVRLNKLGGFEWQKTKQKTRSNVQSIAKELIRLYSQRRSAKGFAFSRDNSLMREFENAFEYVETPSQTIAIREIKEDMQKPQVMERLLCGDVGFGKTEVAMRAAFKCVNDSKQVALLAPTTILAWQHYQTFCERFKGFPVKIALLCRLVNNKKQKEILKELALGKIDIVIGTHRLLQDDVSFCDLGLLIVDEEQRFGVAHKEKLKRTAINVDSLSLSATPIPRTMGLSLSSIIDMSLLEDVPGERFPVQSFVCEYDFELLCDAMQREIDRGGVTFYLLNNTSLLHETAAKIQKRLPESRIAVAHGKMDKNELLSVWKELTLGNIDILVCTTIIETGIDLHSANTLIIENADHFGLSQLHQIRGRVGRSDKRAYAYFTYKKDKIVNEIAEKRLNAIRQYTEFKSGFKLALVDLEIRGAGSFLDKHQHGHLNNVGYDMYMKLLNEAILIEKGEDVPEEKRDCSVDIGVSAYFDSFYIRDQHTRMEFYKKIAASQSDTELYEIEKELKDRFGELPKAAKSLLAVSRIRRTARECGVDRVVQDGEHVRFFTSSQNEKTKHLLADKYFFVLRYFNYKPPYYELLVNKDKVVGEIQAFLDDLLLALKNEN